MRHKLLWVFIGLTAVLAGACTGSAAEETLEGRPGEPQPDASTPRAPSQCADKARNCGAPCKACPTCDDGVLNGDETLIDCGGSCKPCTCTDGQRNNGETGVDCGGPCASCAPRCDDRIQNGSETGIDCGGSCGPCNNSAGCVIGADCISGSCVKGKCEGLPLAAACATSPQCADNYCLGGTCSNPTDTLPSAMVNSPITSSASCFITLRRTGSIYFKSPTTGRTFGPFVRILGSILSWKKTCPGELRPGTGGRLDFLPSGTCTYEAPEVHPLEADCAATPNAVPGGPPMTLAEIAECTNELITMTSYFEHASFRFDGVGYRTLYASRPLEVKGDTARFTPYLREFWAPEHMNVKLSPNLSTRPPSLVSTANCTDAAYAW